MSIVTDVVDAVLQVILFGLIPLFWWLATARKKTCFFRWIGLQRPALSDRRRFYCFFIGVTAAFCGLGLILIPLLVDMDILAASRFAGKGTAALVPAIFYAFIQTGLSEELLFRGFLGKRLSSRFGFATGNTLQAAVFGILHGVMFQGSGALAAVTLVILTGAVGWCMGYMNEKLTNGSIVPSWVVHGISNFVTALAVMF